MYFAIELNAQFRTTRGGLVNRGNMTPSCWTRYLLLSMAGGTKGPEQKLVLSERKMCGYINDRWPIVLPSVHGHVDQAKLVMFSSIYLEPAYLINYRKINENAIYIAL